MSRPKTTDNRLVQTNTIYEWRHEVFSLDTISVALTAVQKENWEVFEILMPFSTNQIVAILRRPAESK